MSALTAGAYIVTLARSVGRSDGPCARVPVELAGTVDSDALRISETDARSRGRR